MANKQDKVSMAIKKATNGRLIKRMKYGDSYDSAISRLLDKLDTYEPLPPETAEGVKNE